MRPAFDYPDRSKKLNIVLASWDGTPFVPYMAKRGVGCDCVRFAHAVYMELGLARPVEWPAYSMQSANRQELDKLYQFIESAGAVEEVSINHPSHGDMLVFSSGRAIHHTGIYTEFPSDLGARIWHCMPPAVQASWWDDSTFTAHLKRIYRPMI